MLRLVDRLSRKSVRRMLKVFSGVATLAIVASATHVGLANGATSNRISVLPPQTFTGTWTWTGANFANSTPTNNQDVVVFVNDVTTSNRNAAAILRYSSSTNLLRAKVSGTEFALEDGAGLLKRVNKTDTATSGSLHVSVIGTTVSMRWNGVEVLNAGLVKTYSGTSCGVQVWQDVASSVRVGGVCASASTSTTVTTAIPATVTTTRPPTTVVTTVPVTTIPATIPATTSTTRLITTTTAAPSPSDRSPGWLSGASGPDASNGTFGTWRGSPIEIGGTWLNDPALYTLTGSGELANFSGPVDVGIAPPSWSGWQAEANGIHDDFYRQMFTNLRAARAGKGTVYVRPWYEFNGNWMPYSVAPGQEQLFKQAWIRMAGIARAAFPDVKLVLCASAANGANVMAAFPGKQYVDVGGIDFYNNWPFVTTQAGFDDKIINGAGAYSLEKLRSFYGSQGVPVAINEWSNQGAQRSTAQGGGGESPQFMNSMYNYIRSHAGSGPGQITYEVLFNLWPAEFQLYPANQTVQPLTAAEYAKLF